MKKRIFTEEEEKFVIDNYTKILNKEICNTLNISTPTLHFLLKKLNLKRLEKVKIGDIFGKLTVIDKVKKQHGNRLYHAWLCVCECGKQAIIETNTLTSGHSSSCGCQRIISIYKGGEIISGGWFGQLKRNAKTRDFEFDLTIDDLEELLKKQDFKCALSGLPLHIDKGRRGKKYYQNTTASLDRIDNSKHYTKDNIQFVHKHINYMKWTHNQNYFIDLCRKIAKYNDES